MIHSLRFRLLLTVGLVVVAAVAAVGYVSSRITTAEFHKFQLLEDSGEVTSPYPEEIANRLAAHFATTGSWEGSGDILIKAAAELERRRIMVLFDGSSAFAASSSPRLADASVEPRPGGGLRLSAGIDRPGEAGAIELLLTAGGLPLEDESGGQIGTLYSIPAFPDPVHSPADRFLVAVNRWLIFAVAGAGLLALLATYLLSRRIVGPVEALTGAARRLERGDLTQRVPVSRGDEIGQLAAAFNAMAARLERTEQLRRQTVSDVAHELRTPLTAFRCQLESIQDGVIQPSVEVIASLHDDLLSLQQLVDDLQDLALAEADQLKLERRPVDLEGEVEAIVRILVHPHKDEGDRPRQPEVRISLHGLPAADVDPFRFRQIMRNLLTNALTHTPPHGTIVISARPQNDRIEISVDDDGPGIPPEHLPNIFERFYRADPSRARKTGGAGLGLAIAKQLVEIHGGRIWADNKPGHGAIFVLTLPIWSTG